MKHTEEPDAEKDTCPVLRGTGRQLVKLGAPRLLDHAAKRVRLQATYRICYGCNRDDYATKKDKISLSSSEKIVARIE